MGTNYDESITGTPEITITEDPADIGPISLQVSGIGIYNQTEVKYKIAGGLPGKTYILAIMIVTTNGQSFEDRIKLEVR
jgi:hypothetical protein